MISHGTPLRAWIFSSGPRSSAARSRPCAARADVTDCARYFAMVIVNSGCVVGFVRMAASGVRPLIAVSNVARETPAAAAFGQIDSRNCRNSATVGTAVSWFSAGGVFGAVVGFAGWAVAGLALALLAEKVAASAQQHSSAVAAALSVHFVSTVMRNDMTRNRKDRNRRGTCRPCARRRAA